MLGFGVAVGAVVVLLIAFGVGLVQRSWPPDWALYVVGALLVVSAATVAASFLSPEDLVRGSQPQRRPRVFVSRSGGVVPLRARIVVGVVLVAVLAGVFALHGFL